MSAIIGGPNVTISDDDLVELSRVNPGWKFERTNVGELIVSPTSTPGGAKSGEAFAQLYLYAKGAGGKAYDAATGFKMSGGGVLSPDASWIRADRIAQFRDDTGYWQMMPDVVIEVATKSDAWPALCAKIDAYCVDGAVYAIAIDPTTRTVYELGSRPNGLVLDIDAINDA